MVNPNLVGVLHTSNQLTKIPTARAPIATCRRGQRDVVTTKFWNFPWVERVLSGDSFSFLLLPRGNAHVSSLTRVHKLASHLSFYERLIETTHQRLRHKCSLFSFEPLAWPRASIIARNIQYLQRNAIYTDWCYFEAAFKRLTYVSV